MLVKDNMDTRHFRTLFISDVHLGSKAAKADFLLDFLKYHDADTIFLVGDIVDGWRLKRSWYWPQDCNDVIQKLLRKARKGTRVVYIPGNHDEFLRDFPGMHFGGIEVAERMIHEAADGKKYLVLHGDEFDVVVRNARLLAYLGDWVESCTAIVEHEDGTFELIEWRKIGDMMPAPLAIEHIGKPELAQQAA
jgi:UDP-2,3-diacylglucosamine pyrophosphatase LpxH